MEEEIKTVQEENQTVEVVDIQFRPGQKVYYFDPAGQIFQAGDHVIIDTARGPEFGYCAGGNHTIAAKDVVTPLRSVLRLATAEDEKTLARNRSEEKRAFEICQQKIAAHGLDMQLVSAEYAFDGSKILFFFTADERVDFRELVKNLASVFHTRIELRQIGVRDESKMLGGLGICGRPFCCATFLGDFQPVSIKMAKEQNLSLNPTKISGTCGRLMCCLKYEQDAYEDLVKKTPKAESFVETPDGAGTVASVSLLRQQVKVRLDSAPDSPKCYHNCEICVIRNGKGKRPEDYVEPPLEELAKLRRVPEEDEIPVSPEPGRRFGGSFAATLDWEPPKPEPAPVEEPPAPAPAGESGEQKSHHSRRRHRGGRGKGGDRSPGQQAQPEKKQTPKAAPEKKEPSRGQPEKKAAPKAVQGEQAPAGEKKSNHRRRWRRRPKKSGGEGAQQQ